MRKLFIGIMLAVLAACSSGAVTAPSTAVIARQTATDSLSFTADCAGLTCTFTHQEPTGGLYNQGSDWFFGDGTYWTIWPRNERSVTHTYAVGGTYTVTLHLSYRTSGGTKYGYKVITIP